MPNLVLCSNMSKRLDDLYQMEESYWYMRTRAHALKDSEKNTQHFLHKASSRRRRNTIHHLTDDNGVRSRRRLWNAWLLLILTICLLLPHHMVLSRLSIDGTIGLRMI